MFARIKKWWSNLPNKKKWVDLITAMLTIPVLITVIISNISRLKKEKDKLAPSPEVVHITKEVVLNSPTPLSPSAPSISSPSPSDNMKPSVTPICNQNPQPFEVSYPQEGELVKIDPVCIVLEPKGSGFCPTKWAYRVNNTTWSSYTSDPICLYNMREGLVRLEIRTKSTVSGREETIMRNFFYQKSDTVTATPGLSPSVSPIY